VEDGTISRAACGNEAAYGARTCVHGSPIDCAAIEPTISP
jgi:hypothetical protein